MREGVSAPFVAPRANGSSFGASEHASCVTCATWATGSAGTKRSSGERRGEVAGGARERGTCAKRGAPCSLLRERAAGPWGRANAPPSPFARPGRRGDRDEAERRRAVRRGSRRSEGGCSSTSATCPHARLCSPPTARARGHAAAAVLGLRKRPGLPSHPPPSPPPRGTRRGARLDLHPALLPLSVLLADPARRLPALAHTTHSSLPFRCSGELLGGGEGPRSRACGGRPLRRCAVGAGILVDRFLGGIACFRRAYRHPLEAAPR